MRNMSFSLTTDQVRSRTKTVTRRLGWKNLKPGDHVRAVEKAMGLKKGEKIKPITEIVCVSNVPEPLWNIVFYPIRSEQSEMEKEGFPDMSPDDFVLMFCQEMKCLPHWIVNRIEFMYVDQEKS